MTAYDAAERRDDPRDPRRASGVDSQGNPLYQCENCGQHLAADAFSVNKYGTLLTICTTCAERHVNGTGRQRFYKDRSHITVTEKKCATCKEVKPSDEFWLDGKQADGLGRECGLCKMRARRARASVETVTFDNYTPASALQPALDQAISQNDELKAELEHMRAELDRARVEGSPAPNIFDARRLARLEEMVRGLSARVDELVPAPKQPFLQRTLTQVARAAGPLGYRLFAWAEQYIDPDTEEAYDVNPEAREHNRGL